MALFLRVFKLILLLPNPVISSMAWCLGNLVYFIFPYRRSVIRSQIQKTLGKAMSKREIKNLVRRNYIHYANLLFESLILSSLDFKHTDYFDTHFTIVNLKTIKKALARNKGVIALCCHLGVWEAMGACCARYIAPVTVVVKLIKNRFVQHLRERMQAHPGITLVDERMGKGRIVEILKALRRGDVAGIFIDQHRPSENFVKFFGYEARTNSAAAVLWRKTAAPLFFSYIFRERFGKYVLVLKEVQPPVFPDNMEEKEVILALNELFNQILEAEIKKHPDQWLWAHRRFKDNEEFKY
jgi:KDO2-lipid IV(A) lauroyltransferase